jgi:hypothetical protein
MTRGRRDLNQQASLQKWLSDQLEEARRSVLTEFSHQMIDVQSELREALNAHIRAQKVRAVSLRDAADRSLREDSSSREQFRRTLGAQKDRLGQLSTETDLFLSMAGSDRVKGTIR